MGEELSRLYRIAPWPEDPYAEEGRKRYEAAKEEFSDLIKHDWLSELIQSREIVRLLDVCGGTGIGGVALARALRDVGKSVELTVLDLRRDALEVAERFGREELGEVSVVQGDATRLADLGLEADVCLVYGLATPHFNPWSMVKLMAGLADALVDDGLLIVEEADRVYTILYLRGYKEWLPERASEDRIFVTVHSGYDFRKGVFKRLGLELKSGEGPVPMEVHFWSLAGLMALAWPFFEDVDFVAERGRPWHGFVLAKNPRRKLSSPDFEKTPRTLEAN